MRLLRPTPVLALGLAVGVLAAPATAAPDAAGAGSEGRPDPKPDLRPEAGVAAAQSPAQAPDRAGPVVLANHRAVYDLSLAEGGGTRSVEGARGRIVVDFRGDACRGYTMQTRQVVELSSGETGPRLTDMRSTTFEGGQGREFRFRTTTLTGDKAAAPVDGTASEGADGLSVRLKGAKPLTDAGPVLFPSLHMRRLVEAARAGQSTLSAKVYDGSDDGRKIYDTFAVIGHAAALPAAGGAPGGPGAETPGRDRPLRTGAIAAMPHWPVRLSYFTAGAGERTPVYTLGFDLYENGVSGALKLDYGDFAILGDMTALDIDAGAGGKDGAKDAGKGCTP